MYQQKQKNPNNIGGLWIKTSTKTGKKYMSGNIEVNGQKIKISVFKNERKQKETQPDYQILLSTIAHKQTPPVAEEENGTDLPF